MAERLLQRRRLMPETQRYCTHCGAANGPENSLCFACQAPLNGSPENTDTLLNGRYRLLTQVGSGGFGGVYRAVDTAEALRIVAVKEITLRGLSTQEAIEATEGFHRELLLLSALRHPNLPRIRDSFTDAEHWYLVMDFIDGESLELYLQHAPAGRLSLDETLEIGLQLCTVLQYLHTREPAVIFRDLKPSNVMRTASGLIYLVDFGIARHFTPGKPRDTMPFGSPGYAAPEQYGRAQTTPQADIYSLGALLHHLLTGSDPAESPFRFATLPMADSKELAKMDTLLQRMVATEPGERPASIAEVKTTLQNLQDGLRRKKNLTNFDPASLRPGYPGAAKKPHVTRRRVLTAALTVGGTVVGAGIIVTLCSVAVQLTHEGPHGTTAIAPPSPGVAQQHLVYQGHKGPITTLSWSPDGTMVASGSADKTVQVWRASDGALLYTYLGYDDPITSLAWAPAANEKNRITSGGMSDGTVQVWNALQDDTYLTFHGDGRALALSWQIDSPWIVSGGTDRKIYVWNGMTGEKCTSYIGHRGDMRAVTWLPSLQFPLSAMNIDGTATPNPATPNDTSVLIKNPIASGGADGTVQIWNGDTGKHLLTYSGHTAGINGLAALRDPGNYFQGIASASDDHTIHIWNPMSTATYAYRIYREHSAKVNAVAALPSLPYYGPRVASASDDHSVQVWSSGSGKRLLTYGEHRAPVKAVAASPLANDNRIVSGDENGLVHLWTIDHTSYQ
jgi:WD40 repeat protein